MVTYRRTILIPVASLTSQLAIDAFKHSTTQRLYSDSVFVMLVSVLIGNKRYCKFIKINQYTNALHYYAMSTSDETMREQHHLNKSNSAATSERTAARSQQRISLQ